MRRAHSNPERPVSNRPCRILVTQDPVLDEDMAARGAGCGLGRQVISPHGRCLTSGPFPNLRPPGAAGSQAGCGTRSPSRRARVRTPLPGPDLPMLRLHRAMPHPWRDAVGCWTADGEPRYLQRVSDLPAGLPRPDQRRPNAAPPPGQQSVVAGIPRLTRSLSEVWGHGRGITRRTTSRLRKTPPGFLELR